MSRRKEKPLLNEHIKAGFLASEFLFEWEAIRQCFVFTKVFEWSNPSTNQMQTKITSDLVTRFARALPALCPRFRQFAWFFFEFSFYKVLSNKAMHLPRSVRSSHWSKASIVWIKNKSNQTISHSYLCKSRSSEEKVERKVTDADKNFTVSTPRACTSLKWN